MRDFLHQCFVVETANDIFSSDFFYFSRSVLLNEVFDEHIATAHSDENLIPLFDLDVDTLRSELVDSLRLTQEHDLHAVSFRISIDELSQCSINFAELVRYVDQMAVFKLLVLLD